MYKERQNPGWVGQNLGDGDPGNHVKTDLGDMRAHPMMLEQRRIGMAGRLAAWALCPCVHARYADACVGSFALEHVPEIVIPCSGWSGSPGHPEKTGHPGCTGRPGRPDQTDQTD